jgi:hypothetical protein
VGVASLLIACKYEEIYPPEVRDCVYITDQAYSREEVLEMEEEILRFLNFHVSVPTAYVFLARYLKIASGSRYTTHRAHYFAERSLQEHDMLKYKPSVVAAAAIYLALRAETLDAWVSAPVPVASWSTTTASHQPFDQQLRFRRLVSDPALWPRCEQKPELAVYTGYTEEEILPCAVSMSIYVSETTVTASRRQLNAVKKKFASSKYLEVSELDQPVLRPAT